MASDFDSFWETAAARLDSAVDGRLGDRIRYAVDGVTFAIVAGFVIVDSEGAEGYAAINDDMSTRRRVKIRQSAIPAPALGHRLQHPKLGAGTFRPTNSIPETQGRYWLFDIQKV